VSLREGLIRFFRIAAIGEAITWTGLIVGMILKYVVVGTQVGVQIFGTLHGIACVAYVFSVLLVRPQLRWDNRTTLIGLAVSVPPLLTYPFERWAMEQARKLPPEEPGPARPQPASPSAV
jgi:integral membrane protein